MLNVTTVPRSNSYSYLVIGDVIFTHAKKVLFTSGNGSEKVQYMTLLKMALIKKTVSITAWQSQYCKL